MVGVRASVARAAILAVVASSGCRDILGVEELDVAAPDAAVDVGPACGRSGASGACNTCLTKSCCGEIDACLADESCRRSFDCLSRCPPNDEKCAASCVVSFKEVLANALSCRARSCSDACSTSCGGILGVVRPKHVANKAECAPCYREKACAQSAACAADPKCLRSLACQWSCPLLDRACVSQCRHPLGAQAGADEAIAAMRTCGTACGDGTDWSCVGVSKYAVGPRPGEVPLHVRLIDAASPTKLAGATLRPCIDVACTVPGGNECVSDDTGLCQGSVVLTSPGNAFPGFFELSRADLYPTMYFVHPPITGAWAGSRDYAPQTALAATKTAFAAGVGIGGVEPRAERGHLVVGIFDCLASPAIDVTVSVSPTDELVAVRYQASALPSPTATRTDGGGTAFVLNILPSLERITVTVKLGDRVVAETPVFIRAETLSFLLLGPR